MVIKPSCQPSTKAQKSYVQLNTLRTKKKKNQVEFSSFTFKTREEFKRSSGSKLLRGGFMKHYFHKIF